MKNWMVLLFTLFTLNGLANGIFGSITHKESKKPIAGATVVLSNQANAPLVAVITNENGEFGFDLKDKGNFIISIYNKDVVTQQLTDIDFDGQEAINLKFLMGETQKSVAASSTAVRAKRLEKSASNKVLNQGAYKNGYYTDGRGNLRSSVSGGNITYIIDGQVSSSQSAKFLVPGSIESIDYKTK